MDLIGHLSVNCKAEKKTHLKASYSKCHKFLSSHGGKPSMENPYRQTFISKVSFYIHLTGHASNTDQVVKEPKCTNSYVGKGVQM